MKEPAGAEVGQTEPAPIGADALDWRWWQRFGLAVGPFVVTAKADGQGWRKAPAQGRKWGADALGPWWGVPGGKAERWYPRWRPGFHLGRSRVVALDVDAPAGHKGRPPLDVQLRELAAVLGADALDAAPLCWRTGGGGVFYGWHLPPDVELPPGGRRVVTLPGCSFTVEILSGEALAVLPHAAAAPPFYALLRPPVARDDPAAAPLPPAILDALRAASAADAAARPAPSEADAGHLAAVAAHVPGAKRRGDGWRAPCPRCARRGRKDRRLSVYLRRDGRVGLYCHGSTSCPTAAVLSALALPLDVLAFVAGDGTIAPDVADAVARFRHAAEAAIMERAPAGQRRIDRRILNGLADVAAAAGQLDAFACAFRTLALVAGAHVRTLRGPAGAVARVLARYPDLVARVAAGGIGADGTRSTVWRLTPPAAGAGLDAPAIAPGGNAARALSSSGRGDAWRMLDAWPDDGAAAMTRRALAALLPGVALSTLAGWLADALAAGVVVEVNAPPGARGRGRPARWYALAGAARAAVAARSDVALAALLPSARQGRADAAAATVTARRDRLTAALDDAKAKGRSPAAAMRHAASMADAVERSARAAAIDRARVRAADAERRALASVDLQLDDAPDAGELADAARPAADAAPPLAAAADGKEKAS